MSDDAATWVLSLTDNMSGPAKAADSALVGVEGALKKTGNAAEESGSRSNAAFGAMNSAALGVAAAMGTAALAAGALTLKMADMALHAREAADAALELAQAEYGHTAAAKAVVDAQYQISASSSLSQDAIFDLGTQLERSGVSASQFQSTLRAMADTSAVAGDAALKSIQKVVKTVEQTGSFKINESALKGSGIKIQEVYAELAKSLGGSSQEIATKVKLGQISAEQGIAAMNKALEQKFGAGAAEKLLGFDTQISKAKENLSNLFKDVNTGPFLSALHQVLGILDPATASGKALHKALTSAMNGFFSAAASALPYVEAFFLNLVDAALDVYDASKPIIKNIETMLGLDTAKPADGFKIVASAAKVVVYAIAAVVAIAGLATVGMIAVWQAVAHGVQIAISAVKRVGSAFSSAYAAVKSFGGKVIDGLSAGVDYLKSLPGKFADAGAAMIDGLINAIKSGAAKVVGAVSDMAGQAVQAAKSKLGIASPSKVFFEIGTQNVAGLVNAHKDGATKVQASIKHMVSIPVNDTMSRFRAEEPQAPQTSGSGRSLTVAQGAVIVHIHAAPGQSTDELGKVVRREILSAFEELATGTGGR